jgi:hypothetical protein
VQTALERDAQAVGKKRDDDMRLDPMLDRPDGEVPFELLERF